METELRRQAIAAGYDPDKIVTTELLDKKGERIEMPIWQTFFFG